MADKKISALPAASTPLAGTEVLPIVQSGVTDQVSVANLTAGRDVTVKKLTPTDNVVMASGKGITTGGAFSLGLGSNGNTTQAKIDTSGNFLIAKADADFAAVGFEYLASAKILRNTSDDGTAVQLNRLTSDGDIVGFYRSGVLVGSISVTTTATAYNQSSDARLKANIAPADDAGALIDAIQVRKFDWKADGSRQRYGFVAQELLKVAPEAVSVPADEDQMMGVDYSKLVPMLVKEVQSLRARVAQLEGK